MPYDPSLPTPHSPLESQVIRDQLQALFNLITAAATSAQVDAVTTLPAGSAATADASVSAGVLHLSLGLPQGSEGATGPQGPPFAQAVVDGVTTLDPSSPANVSVAFDGNNVRFTFGLPRGQDGNQGPPGGEGPAGPIGPPGEVTNGQLQSAIGGTSNNSNGVTTLDTAFTNDPPTLADLETMRQKVNELILALRR